MTPTPGPTTVCGGRSGTGLMSITATLFLRAPPHPSSRVATSVAAAAVVVAVTAVVAAVVAAAVPKVRRLKSLQYPSLPCL